MHMLWFLTARTLLTDSHIMTFARQMLVAIMDQPKCLEVMEVSVVDNDCIRDVEKNFIQSNLSTQVLAG